MPVFPCKAPLCPALVAKGRWCDAHRHLAPPAPPRAEYHRHYDQHLRDADAKTFYNSLAWKNARAFKLSTIPFCEECEKAWATTVHHIKPLKECTHAEAIAQDNLKSCCQPCHSDIEAAIRAKARGNAA